MKTVQTLSFNQLSTVSTVEKFLPKSWAQQLPSIHIILLDLLPCAAVPWPMPFTGHAASCHNLALWRWQDRQAQIPEEKGGIFWLETVDLRTSKKKMELQQRLTYINPRVFRWQFFQDFRSAKWWIPSAKWGTPPGKYANDRLTWHVSLGKHGNLGAIEVFTVWIPPAFTSLVIITGPCLVMSTWVMDIAFFLMKNDEPVNNKLGLEQPAKRISGVYQSWSPQHAPTTRQVIISFPKSENG